MIPAQAVEAAAKELYARDGYSPWDKEEASVRARYLLKVNALLEAAAPYIRAQALEDAAAEVDEGVPAYGQGEYADWLRERATEVRTPDAR